MRTLTPEQRAHKQERDRERRAEQRRILNGEPERRETGRVHIVVGDTQAKPDVPAKHLSWIGQYIAEHFPCRFAAEDVAIFHLGDHWDMPSLSSYDEGKLAMEGRRYKQDIDAGNAAFDLLNEPLFEANKKRDKPWLPERHFLLGNHEDRITRAVQASAKLAGTLSLDDLNPTNWGWEVHDFLEPVVVDGISYCHYFYNPNTGRPYAGENLHLRLKTVGRSFTMGHQQGFNYAVRPVGAVRHHGLVLGSSYLHDEKYLGPQGNQHWRGICVCHQVENGMYDLMQVSLDWLCRRYEGVTLAEFMKKQHQVAA